MLLSRLPLLHAPHMFPPGGEEGELASFPLTLLPPHTITNVALHFAGEARWLNRHRNRLHLLADLLQVRWLNRHRNRLHLLADLLQVRWLSRHRNRLHLLADLLQVRWLSRHRNRLHLLLAG